MYNNNPHHQNWGHWQQNPYHWNQGQNPHAMYPPHPDNPQSQQLKHHTLMTIEPIVQYGLKEGQVTSHIHAMREVAAISYLIGRGYDPRVAHQIVESWEINETFYGGQRENK